MLSNNVKDTTLKDIKPGSSCKVIKVGGEGATRRRIMDMGIVKGTLIKVCKLAPLGDPMELRVRGYGLTLRKEDAEKISVSLYTCDKEDYGA